jgi:hypothetical protein
MPEVVVRFTKCQQNSQEAGSDRRSSHRICGASMHAHEVMNQVQGAVARLGCLVL